MEKDWNGNKNNIFKMHGSGLRKVMLVIQL